MGILNFLSLSTLVFAYFLTNSANAMSTNYDMSRFFNQAYPLSTQLVSNPQTKSLARSLNPRAAQVPINSIPTIRIDVANTA